MLMLNNKEIASIAAFGAIAGVVTTVTNLPILPFLRFDMGEIIDFLAFLILGPLAGIIVAFIHFITLVIISGGYAQVPFASQFMKFVAVSSTMLGFLLITRTKSILVGVASAIVVRVLFMALANYLFFFVFFPFTLKGAIASISNFLGYKIEGFFYELLLLLAFTGLFNALHGLITALIPVYILKKSPQIVSLANNIKPVWFVRYLKK